uniref:Cytochrome P450 85A n=1 Tax=Cajanus cajan TaxID=3821 RepID=A0A151TS66_CAJCA|nr:Cytochrome P450 85A [Cajanus cajan]
MRYSKKGMPPGSLGFPFVGETLKFLKQGPDFMKGRRSRYGNLFKTHALGSPMVVSLDPDVNRYILVNEAKGLVPGYPNSMREILGTNIAEVHGATHKRIRGSLLSVIGPIAVKDRILPKVDDFMRSYLHSWDGKTIDLQEKTVEVILETMRLANVVAGVMRRTTSDIELNGNLTHPERPVLISERPVPNPSNMGKFLNWNGPFQNRNARSQKAEWPVLKPERPVLNLNRTLPYCFQNGPFSIPERPVPGPFWVFKNKHISFFGTARSAFGTARSDTQKYPYSFIKITKMPSIITKMPSFKKTECYM